MAESGGGVRKFFCATVFMRDFFFKFDNGEEKTRENTRSSEKNSKDKITPFPIKVTIYGDEAGGKQRSTRVTDAKYARNA